MTRSVIINSLGNVEEVSNREMFRRAFGHYPRTPEQKQAEWDTEVERYAAMILRGCELSPYGNPAVGEAMKRIALREGDAGAVSDPLLKSRRAA